MSNTTVIKLELCTLIIELASNKISDEGCKHIGRLLKGNKTLLTICLGENNITNIGACILAEPLKTNKTLKTLHLCM